MIKIKDSADCCGCSACMQCCPKQCISLGYDNEGFLYPNINAEHCIDCGLCEKVCPIINQGAYNTPLKVYASTNKDTHTRLNSSSGGIFFLLAEQTIRDRGIVFGARFDENWQVVIDYAKTIEKVSAFQGSKYLQAQIGDSYIQAERFLKEGRKVLFTGTPCQIAGLKRFLRKEYKNLIAIDIICHGVPSPKIWDKYLHERFPNKASITNINFRNKSQGWDKYHFNIESNSQENYSIMHKKDPYIRAFLSNLILRPSCHSCNCKSCSGSDITLGDFWGIDKVQPQMNDNKGTSLILINTKKGEEYFPKNKTINHEQMLTDATPYNAGISHSCIPHYNRQIFFRKANNAYSIIKLIEQSLEESSWRIIKYRIKKKLKKLFK